MSDSDLHGDFAAALQFQLARKWNEAEKVYRTLVKRDPAEPVLAYNLGIVLKAQGKFREAITEFRIALRINPHFCEAANNLATTLTAAGELDEAIEILEDCTRENPEFAAAFNNLGDAYKDRGEINRAVGALERAVELQPGNSTFRSNLIYSLHYHPQSTASSLREAAESWTQHFSHSSSAQPFNLSPSAFNLSPSAQLPTVDLSPSVPTPSVQHPSFDLSPSAQSLSTPSNLSPPPSDLSLSAPSDHVPAPQRPILERAPFLPQAGHFDLSPSTFDLSPFTRSPPSPSTVSQPLVSDAGASDLSLIGGGRRRIGYIGAFFRQHCQSLFLAPLLAHHDHTRFEIFCYSDDTLADEVTLRLQTQVDHWCDIGGQSTKEIAQRIRADELDVLIDLGLHTAQNYLAVFAHQPAPRQVTWLGYPGTTGLSTICARLTDPYLDPIGQNDADYSERSIRLPHTFWCYDPTALPGKTTSLGLRKQDQPITFGCLNNFCKVNDAVLALWARVLAQVPHARCVLMVPRGEARSRVLAQLNVEASRITFVEFAPREIYLERYCSIDVCLDTYPYNGHTTSLDALWMGVPVVTLCGRTAVSRAGYALLANLGLRHLVAFSPDEFVRIACDLTRDRTALRELHETLRARLEKSPLMDAPQFARDFEEALFPTA